jgi:hypothetical protein
MDVKIRQSILLITIMLISMTSCSENPVDNKKENRSPEILSLIVFPEIVNPSDSLIVICTATDEDGDSLVYDWVTSGVVKIKGYNHPWFYNSKENFKIFYAPDSQFVSAPQDTFWIQCFVRDGIGGQISERIKFIVKQE